MYGCPAEEILSGKIVMNDHGVFNDLDAAVTWHPFDRNRVSNDIWQAQDIKNYTFHGVSHTVPLITISAAAMCKGTPLHHWAAARQAGMSIGHKGMLYAARCMAEGTRLLIEKPEYLKKAWEAHLR